MRHRIKIILEVSNPANKEIIVKNVYLNRDKQQLLVDAELCFKDKISDRSNMFSNAGMGRLSQEFSVEMTEPVIELPVYFNITSDKKIFWKAPDSIKVIDKESFHQRIALSEPLELKKLSAKAQQSSCDFYKTMRRVGGIAFFVAAAATGMNMLMQSADHENKFTP
jgi:hypothetical protein